MTAKTKKPKTEDKPSYYMRSVAAVKKGAARIARATEKTHKLPAGSVHVSITKLNKATRQALAAAGAK